MKTKDKYILQTFRIQNPKTFNPELPPVLLQHGCGTSAANFIVQTNLGIEGGKDGGNDDI